MSLLRSMQTTRSHWTKMVALPVAVAMTIWGAPLGARMRPPFYREEPDPSVHMEPAPRVKITKKWNKCSHYATTVGSKEVITVKLSGLNSKMIDFTGPNSYINFQRLQSTCNDCVISQKPSQLFPNLWPAVLLSNSNTLCWLQTSSSYYSQLQAVSLEHST